LQTHNRGEGRRFVARADEKLTAFPELESTIRAAERPEDFGGREIKLDKLGFQAGIFSGVALRIFSYLEPSQAHSHFPQLKTENKRTAPGP
jgi:hypothetical protein